MLKFEIYLDDADYSAFRSHPATRLYQHTRKADGTVRIFTAKKAALAEDLEKAIDFGATTAHEVLHALR